MPYRGRGRGAAPASAESTGCGRSDVAFRLRGASMALGPRGDDCPLARVYLSSGPIAASGVWPGSATCVHGRPDRVDVRGGSDRGWWH